MNDQSYDSTDTNDSEAPLERSRFDSLSLPQEQQQVLRVITRQRQASLAEVSTLLNQDQAITDALIKGLIEQGFIQKIEVDGESRYRTNLAAKRGRKLPEQIWNSLEE